MSRIFAGEEPSFLDRVRAFVGDEGAYVGEEGGECVGVVVGHLGKVREAGSEEVLDRGVSVDAALPGDLVVWWGHVVSCGVGERWSVDGVAVFICCLSLLLRSSDGARARKGRVKRAF